MTAGALLRGAGDCRAALLAGVRRRSPRVRCSRARHRDRCCWPAPTWATFFARASSCCPGQRGGEGRRAYLEGLLAQLAGDEGAAREAYRRAYEIAAGESDVHTVAASRSTWAAADRAGLYGEALAAIGAGRARARAPGRGGGAGAGAGQRRQPLRRSSAIWRRRGGRSIARAAWRPSARCRRSLATATFVEGDLARAAGEPTRRRRHYRRRATAFVDSRAAAARRERALRGRRRPPRRRGRLADARRALAEAERCGRRGSRRTTPSCARALRCLALADGGGEPAPRRSPTGSIGWPAAARAASRRPLAWRLAALAARLAGARRRRRQADRRAPISRRTVFEEIRMATPEHHRAGLERDPDALWLAPDAVAGRAAAPRGARAGRRGAAAAPAAHQQAAQQRAAPAAPAGDDRRHGHRADRRRARLPAAGGRERRAEVKVARNIDQRTLETAEFELSRSIARQAAAGGEPIVTIDAAGDARFREALSVSDLHLRSVLAVPLVDQGARRRERSTSTTACARGRSIRRTSGWCSTSPSRRRSRSRTRACSASCAVASGRSRRSTAASRPSWPRGARSSPASRRSCARTARRWPSATTTATSSAARRACWSCSGCSIGSPTRRCRS